MGDRTAIGWTDATWNPVTGCSHVSEGCRHCYAETLSLRLGTSRKPWTAPNAQENVVLHPDRLGQPLRWRDPRRVFVNSMSDLFHEQIPDHFVAQVFALMAAAPRHAFQVLTKRPTRMRDLLTSATFWTHIAVVGMERWWGRRELAMIDVGTDHPLANVWLGVSCEDQRSAEQRIPLLLETPAAVKFVSAEPLLGPIDLYGWINAVVGKTPRLDWVIVGGESGPGHRPMDPAWVHAIVDDCVESAVPVFVKQDSGPRPGRQGRLSDGLWSFKQYPATPEVAHG